MRLPHARLNASKGCQNTKNYEKWFKQQQQFKKFVRFGSFTCTYFEAAFFVWNKADSLSRGDLASQNLLSSGCSLDSYLPIKGCFV